jgi:hypothetical protein
MARREREFLQAHCGPGDALGIITALLLTVHSKPLLRITNRGPW